MKFNWSNLAFGSKKPVDSLKATFIAAPRQLSAARFSQLVKEYLPQGNIVLGLAKEDCVDGFAGQPQFKMLKYADIQDMIDKVNRAGLKQTIATLSYFQREEVYIIEKLHFKQAVFVNGSWQYSFHMRPNYFAAVSAGLHYQLVSPFADEQEAKSYAAHYKTAPLPKSKLLDEKQMLELAAETAKQSFDHTYQTGVALGTKAGPKYQLLATTFNNVVPYQTYAMHHGSQREANFSPANDLNFYDTVHAEMALILQAQKQNISLKDTTLFINLLPCPTCSRLLSQTDISTIVYSIDHSDGYAIKLFELAGKKVRRLVV